MKLAELPDLASIYSQLQESLEQLEDHIKTGFGSDYPFIADLITHISQFKGKRLRPILVFLTARCFGGINVDHVPLAAVVEMIHTATLVHDDVLDEAKIRRQVPTVNQRWSNEVSVLLGDWLFSQAFHLSLNLSSNHAAKYLSGATNRMVGGELLQIEACNRYTLTEAEYFQIIGMKTAELTAVSAQMGALYAGASSKQVKSMYEYGYKLGMAFQIVDDYLDIMGEEKKVGKSLGTDLAQGKMTLPIINVLAMATPIDRRNIIRLIKTADDVDNMQSLRWYLERYDAIEYTFETARRFVNEASQAISFLPDSVAKQSLQAVSDFVVVRKY